MRDPLDALLEASVVGGFSRIGYAVRSRRQHWSQDVPLAGQRLLITGGTSGIGFAAAQRAIAGGAHVAITGRDEARTRAAAQRVGAVPLTADAADLEVIGGLLDRAVDALGGLDVLVNNAGVLDENFTVSPQGFETTYAVHVLAPFLLTATALPLVRKVITVSSGGMYSQSLNPDAMQMTESDYDGVTAYARAKRVQVALNAEWARRFPDGPTFAAMHPGWADTPGVQRSLPLFRSLTKPVLRSPAQGADTIVWLAGEEVESGKFWLDRAPRSTIRVPWLRYGEREVLQAWRMVARDAGAETLLEQASRI